MPRPGIEPGTFRSSVWRSPNWAIAACKNVYSSKRAFRVIWYLTFIYLGPLHPTHDQSQKVTNWLKLSAGYKWNNKKIDELENRGIDPRTSRMLSERSTIWASSPDDNSKIAMGVTPWAFSVFENCRKRSTQWILTRIHEYSCGIHANSMQTNLMFAISYLRKTFVRSGIRTHAHIRGPECSC